MDWHMLFTHPFHGDNDVGWYTGVVIVIDAIH